MGARVLCSGLVDPASGGLSNWLTVPILDWPAKQALTHHWLSAEELSFLEDMAYTENRDCSSSLAGKQQVLGSVRAIEDSWSSPLVCATLTTYVYAPTKNNLHLYTLLVTPINALFKSKFPPLTHFPLKNMVTNYISFPLCIISTFCFLVNHLTIFCYI